MTQSLTKKSNAINIWPLLVADQQLSACFTIEEIIYNLPVIVVGQAIKQRHLKSNPVHPINQPKSQFRQKLINN